MKVGLYLMTWKGYAVLMAALANPDIEITHVTTAEARGTSDDAHLRIASAAKDAGIPTFLLAHPPAYTGDWSIAAGWRWMLDVPNLIVLHDSLLPRYRGFAPLITALVNGERTVGVTSFLAIDVPDAGPIIGQRAIPVTYPTTMASVLGRIVPLYGELARQALAELAEDKTVRYTAQEHHLATYSSWRDDDDYRIDWARDDREIQRLIGAASSPFPGAWTTTEQAGSAGSRVRIFDAVIEPDARFEQRHPGKVAWWRDGDPIVVCGRGMLRLTLWDDDAAELAGTTKLRFR